LTKRHTEKHFHGQAGLDRVRLANRPPDGFLIRLTTAGSPLKVRDLPLLPEGLAPQFISGSNQPLVTLLRNALPVGGSSVIRDASEPRCNQSGSSSCRSVMSVCSCGPATTLDSRHESLTHFVHVWMPPLVQDIFEWGERVIGCGHVSGICVR
jgi:hypothetical protein